MGGLNIRVAQKGDAEAVQKVLMHKSIAPSLGGMTYMDAIKNLLSKTDRGGIFVAEIDGNIVGAIMAAGRPQSHLLKYGSVGVLPEYRRQRIGSALYFALTLQGIVEGRRLYEDTIVGDNPIQHELLPTLGITRSGILKRKTAAGKDLHIYQFDVLDVFAPGVKTKGIEPMLGRVSNSIDYLQVIKSSYTEDLWNKNCDIFARHSGTFPKGQEEMEANRRIVFEDLGDCIDISPGITMDRNKRSRASLL